MYDCSYMNVLHFLNITYKAFNFLPIVGLLANNYLGTDVVTDPINYGSYFYLLLSTFEVQIIILLQYIVKLFGKSKVKMIRFRSATHSFTIFPQSEIALLQVCVDFPKKNSKIENLQLVGQPGARYVSVTNTLIPTDNKCVLQY